MFKLAWRHFWMVPKSQKYMFHCFKLFYLCPLILQFYQVPAEIAVMPTDLIFFLSNLFLDSDWIWTAPRNIFGNASRLFDIFEENKFYLLNPVITGLEGHFEVLKLKDDYIKRLRLSLTLNFFEILLKIWRK